MKFSIENVVRFPQRPRRLEIRITVARGREPIGRTRPLRLTKHDFAWLLEAAERLETRARHANR